MKLAIMQPYLFPYIGYFQLMMEADKFVVFDDVNFIKKGWVNRNNILVNNQSSGFTLNLKNASQNKLIKDIEIFEFKNWATKFLKSLELAYKKAPYFEQTYQNLEQLLNNNYNNISEICLAAIKNVCEQLYIECEIAKSSSVYNNAELKGQERILDICQQENSSHYINAIGGQDLYENKVFSTKNIKLNFLKPEIKKYTQFKHDFVAQLSIIDLMMFVDCKTIESDHLKAYSLI
jgi:hypothetical protein